MNCFLLNAGGGGKLPILRVITNKGASVTAKQGTTTMKATATNGIADFKVNKYGTWNVTSTIDGKSATQNIEIKETIQINVPVGQEIYKLPKDSKVKLGGIGFILKAPLAHSDYADGENVSILVSEKNITNMAFNEEGDTSWGSTSIIPYLREFYDALNDIEKNTLAKHTWRAASVNSSGEWGQSYITQHFALMSSNEIGMKHSSGNDFGTNLGFKTDSDRKVENGAYWLRDSASKTNVNIISASGSYTESLATLKLGVRPAVCIKYKTLVTNNPLNGYYEVLGVPGLVDTATRALKTLGIDVAEDRTDLITQALDIKYNHKFEVEKINKIGAKQLKLNIAQGNTPSADSGVFADNFEEWQPNKEYKQNDLFRYEGNLGFVRQTHTSQENWKPFTQGTESLYGARPKEIDGVYPYIYNMSADKNMLVKENEEIYICYNPIDVMLFPPSQIPAHFRKIE